MTYHEIAAELGVSHTRVQQIEAAALAKIRGAWRGLEISDLLPAEERVDQRIYIPDYYKKNS